MTARYPRIYKLLKTHGHGPVKALEILMDAARGDKYSMEWIRRVRMSCG